MNRKSKMKNVILKTWHKIVLIVVIIIIGGFLYGFAGTDKEQGSLQVMGMVLMAIYFPWELFFYIKRKNSQK